MNDETDVDSFGCSDSVDGRRLVLVIWVPLDAAQCRPYALTSGESLVSQTTSSAATSAAGAEKCNRPASVVSLSPPER